ncbi:MFS transporter [Phaeacidiphilus oryzae]|uniref:MFS transporter n=1 Tax=Phaeacidiphilus oryzae TaxID=348818 RepID=UPI0006897A47|nr:MFS transporter [Phaeacidiphilus oryzae]
MGAAVAGDSEERAPARDLRLQRARRSVAVVFAVHGAVTGSFATRIPWIQGHLGLSTGQLGLALAAPAVGASLAMPLASRIVHRYGERTAVGGLLVLWCLALALPSLSPDLPVLCAALLVYGATAGMADVAMNAQGVGVEQRLGRSIMSGLHGMWSVGGLVASLIGALAAHYGVDARVHHAVMALLLAGIGLFAARGLLDVRPEPGEAAPPRFALPPRSALAIGLVGFCAVFAEGAGSDWSGVYLRDVAGASAGVAASAYTAFACTMAASRLAGDLLVRRLGAVRTVRWMGVASVLGGLLVALGRGQIPAIAGFALIGVGIAVVVPLAFAAAGKSGPNPSQAIAGIATISYTSGLVAPAVIGAIAQATSLPVSFGLVTLLLLIGLVGCAGALRAADARRD